MKITGVQRSKRSGLKASVRFDDGSTVVFPTAVVMSAGLRRGVELDEAAVQKLQLDAEQWRCREAALRLVGFRARSGKELRGRLLQRGFPAQVVEHCVEELFRSGLLDDQAFAAAYAGDRLRSRPVGRSRLLLELRAKGVDEETAREAAEEAYAAVENDETEMARRAARRFRRRSGEDEDRAKRRLFGLLARRGFSRDAIKAIASELIG